MVIRRRAGLDNFDGIYEVLDALREEITPKLQDLVPGDILDEFDVVLVGEGVDPSVEFERALGGVETRRRSRGNSMNLAFGALLQGYHPRGLRRPQFPLAC